ncbi:orf77 [Lactobacillus phage LP65]|uniref:Orf77 n=1 Tax=Lactobacillus phage LP65 TaxID=2892344 RepID=Q5ULN7_9CAUD|nr:hypothetical protein LP65_gp077 [Lactobacillus phage LP65]AAV35897.1 orf77 [Lactobacillus phage LP65]
MSNKHTSSRSSGIQEQVIEASRANGMTEQIIINKDTIFENGIIGEKLLSKQVVEKLGKIDKLQRDNDDLMNRVKELERKINKKRH